jgi:hypothetical protein
MDHGPEMNEKINQIKNADESGQINDIIQYQFDQARTNEKRNKILRDWKMATEQAVLLDVTNENTKEIALQLNSIIDGLRSMSSMHRSPEPPRIRRRQTRGTRSPPAVSPTSRRLRQGVENNPSRSRSRSRSRSPVRRRRTRGHQSTGGKGHRKNKTHKRKHKRSKKA